MSRFFVPCPARGLNKGGGKPFTTLHCSVRGLAVSEWFRELTTDGFFLVDLVED